MDWASEGFDHKFTVEGDEILVTGDYPDQLSKFGVKAANLS